jgi:beta-lactamase regulating signal transducer with metallopeptidase domain
MELLRGLAGSDLVLRLGWALVHSLWQGLAVAMLLAVVLRMLSRRSPAARYLAACAAMVLMLAGLAVTPWVLAPSAVDRPAARAARTPSAVSAMPIPAAPADVDGPPDTIPPSSDLPAGYGTGGEGKAAPIAPVPGLLQRVGRVLQPALPWTVAAWLAGVAVIGIYQLTGYLAAQRLRRLAVRPAETTLETVVSELARRLRLSRPVRVLESALVRVPTVVGWLWPAILLPVGFATGLSPHQVRAILLHELAHIRRYDYLVNLLQTLVETLLFYHPAVWWVSARVRGERENCCDDAAVAAGGEPVSYAESLLALAQRAADDRRLGSPGRARAMAAATGVYAAGRPSQLRLRVARLLGAGARPHRRPRTWPVALLVLAAGLIGCATMLSAMGRPGQPDAVTQSAGPALEFRIAPYARSMGSLRGIDPDVLKAQREGLQQGRVGRWWEDLADWSGPFPQYIWLPLHDDGTRHPELVSGQYQGRDYLLVSDRPEDVMLAPGPGRPAWGLAKVYAQSDDQNRPAVGFQFDRNGAELFHALTSSHIRQAMATVVHGEVVSAPVINSAMQENGMILGQFTPQQMKDLIRTLEKSLPPTTEPAEQFGPVIERTLNHTGELSLINLDSGEPVTSPRELPKGNEEFIRWARTQGIDAGGNVQSISPGLTGFDLVAIPIPNNFWDRGDRRLLLQATSETTPGNPVFLVAKELPATFIIKTREGSVGLLRILAVDSQAGTVTVRYKLLKDPTPEAPSPSTAPAATDQDGQAPQSAAQVPWGPEVKGLSARLRAERTTWAADQTPRLWVDIRVVDPAGDYYVGLTQRNYQLEMDGVWYVWADVQGGRVEDMRSSRTLPEQLVTISPMWAVARPEDLRWRSPDEARPIHEYAEHLALAPGRHSVRLAYIADPARATTWPGVRVISNPVTIEVTPADTTGRPGTALAKALGPGRNPIDSLGELQSVTDPAARQKLIDMASAQVREIVSAAGGTPLEQPAGRLSQVMAELEQTDLSQREAVTNCLKQFRKIRWDMIVSLSGDPSVVPMVSPGSVPLAAPLPGMQVRRFLRLVVGTDRMTLEGEDVTMESFLTAESLLTALEAVPDREQTVLEFAVTGDDVPASRVVEATALAVAAAREYGFKYFSDTGTHPLGTMGDATKTLGISQAWTEGPITFDAPLAVDLKLLHPPMPGYRGSEPFEVLCAQRLTFTRQGNQVQAGLAASLTSYPKATYVVTLELLDAAGKALAGKKAQLEASGEAIGQALRFQEHLIFPLGAADKLASATTWRLTLSIVSSDGIPTTTSAPAGVAEAAQEFLSLLQAEQWDQAGGLMAGVADAAQQIALLRRVSPELGIVSMYADPSEGLAVTGPIKDEPAREGAFLIHLQNSSAGWRVAEVRHVGSVAAQLRIESFLGSHPDARSEAVKEVSHNPFTAPDTKALVRPQEAMDLDAARGDEVAPWPAAFDVAWTGDEWVLNPDSQARVMTIDGVEDFAGAAAKAIGMIKPLMTSRQRELAGPARFAAVLTSQGNLAIIEAAPAEGKAPYGSLNWALGRIVPEGDRYRVVKFDGFRRQFRQTQLDQPAPDRTTAHPAGTPATRPAAATPLHQAAAGGHVQTVQELVRAGADPNARDAAGQTPLHLAAAGGHGQTAEALIRLGSDPNARDAAGQTPLHLAAAGGHGQTAEALIRLGSDPAARDAAGQTPLDLAAAGGHGQTSQALATAGANPASQSAGPTGQVSAAALVREVRAQEQWIEQANSFHARVESRWTRNPDLVAQERAKLEAQDTQVPQDERNNPNLRPEYTTTDELAFDRQRIIQISSDPGVCDRWRVWNGRECIELSKPSTSDRAMVVLANKTELGRWFEHFWLTLSWLRAGPHTFWWTSERPEGQEQLFGQPEEYVLIGQEPFRGRECYVLDCAATFLTLYVGVDDHRLHGLTRHALESWTHPEIERVLMELAAQHGAALSSPQEYDQWLHRQPLELQHALSKEYSVRLRPVAKPQATHWLDDYRQVAPGCYLPMDQGYTIFRHTGPDQMVEDVRRQMKVTRIRVNEPLEDSLFDVRIPDGAQVEDRRQPEDAF